MDLTSTSWFSELGMDDPIFMDQCDIMDSFDEELAAALGEDFHNSLSSESNCSSTLIHRSSSTTTLCSSPTAIEAAAPPPQNQNVGIERPTKHHKPNSYNNNNNNTNTMRNLDQAPCSVPIILSFGGNSDNLAEQGGPIGAMNHEDEAVSDALMSQAGSYLNLEDAAKGTKKANARTRPPSQTYDHIIAERKRREQLSQRFVALSAIVPGLKKMDKTSVLGDAIKYLKVLQERVKILEEQATKQTMESVVLVKKSQLLVEDEGSSDENSLGSCSENSLPEIEARVCDKSVLLRIHCEKRKGVLVKILSEVEKLNLSVANTSVSPFGTLALDITIIAEMEKEFCTSVKDIVRSLRSALRRVA